jgi:hypothetical protein
MFLLKANTRPPAEAEVWTARAELLADPDQVLQALTDPELIAQWAPVRFDVDGLAGGRLRTGSHERVSGTIGGLSTTFDIEVARADVEQLDLVARGPVSFEVAYSFREQGRRVIVEAYVSLRRQPGLTAQVLRAAVSALLNAGALGGALRRLEASLSRLPEAECVAA